MKKQFKRILALALTVLMVVGVVPMAIFAVAADAPADKTGKYIAPNAEELQAALGDKGELMFYYPFSGSDFDAGSYTNGKAYSYARTGATVFDGSSVLLKASSDAGKANLPMYTQGGTGWTEQPGDKADANRAFVYSFDIKAADYNFFSGFSCAVRSKMTAADGSAKYMDKPIFALTSTCGISVGGNVVAQLSTEVYTNFAIAVNPDPEVNTYTAYINGEEVASGTFLAAGDYTTMAGYGYAGFCFSQIYMSYESASNKNKELAYFDNVTAYWGDTFIKGETLTYTGTKYDSAIKYEDLFASEDGELDLDALGDKLLYYNNFEGDERGDATFTYTNCTENVANGVFAPLAVGGVKPEFTFTPAENVSGTFVVSFDVMINSARGADPSASIFFTFTSGDSKEWFRIYGNPYGEIHPLLGAAAGAINATTYTNIQYIVDTVAKSVTLLVNGTATYTGTFNGGDFTGFKFSDIRTPSAGQPVYYFDNILLYEYEVPEPPFTGTMKHFNDLNAKNANKVFGDTNCSWQTPDKVVFHMDGKGGYAMEGQKSDNYYAIHDGNKNNGGNFVISADFKYVPGVNKTGLELLGTCAYGANTASYGRDFNVAFVYVAADGSLWLASEKDSDGIIVNAYRYCNAGQIDGYFTEKIGQLHADTFTNVAVYVDVASNCFNVYLDGILVVDSATFLSDKDYTELSETATYGASGFGVTYTRIQMQPGKIIDNVAYYYADGIIESKINTDPITGFVDTAAGVAYYKKGFRQTGVIEIDDKTYVADANGILLGGDGKTTVETPYGFYIIGTNYEAVAVESDLIAAVDKNTGVAYETFEEAIENSTGTIKLNQYQEFEELVIEKSDVTIDLNGQEFYADSIAILGNNFNFIDTGAVKGVIYAADNTQIAITNDAASSVLAYSEDRGGYVVFDVKDQQKAPAVNAENGRLEFKFRPSLDNNTDFNAEFFANAVAADVKMFIDVVAYDTEGGVVTTLNLEAEADLLATVYADSSKLLKLSIGGHEAVAKIDIKVMIISDAGTYNLATATYTTPVVEA